MPHQVSFAALQYPISIAEVESFSRDADKLLAQEALHHLVDFIAMHPSAGDLIPDSGGVRVLHWAPEGQGGRGGVHVVYYFRDLNMPLYLLALYGRGERPNLSATERRQMKNLVDALVESHYQQAAAVAGAQLRPA